MEFPTQIARTQVGDFDVSTIEYGRGSATIRETIVFEDVHPRRQFMMRSSDHLDAVARAREGETALVEGAFYVT